LIILITYISEGELSKMLQGFFEGLLNAVNKRKYLFLLISAFLAASAFTFSFLWPVTWISLIFFSLIILSETEDEEKKEESKRMIFKGRIPKRALRRYYFFFLIYHILIYYWFIRLYPFDSMGFDKGSAAAITALAWFGISMFHALIYTLAPFLFCLLRPRRMNKGILRDVLDSALLASLWLLSQHLTSLGALGFPWSRLYITQYTALPVIQSSALFGGSFITFLIVFVNTLMACSVKRHGEECGGSDTRLVKRRYFPLLLAIGVFVANLSFGAFRLAFYDNGSEETLDITLVQGNIVSGEKWQSGAAQKALDLYSSLTLKAFEEAPADIILWPESAVPLRISEGSDLLKIYGELAEKCGAEFFTGAFYVSSEKYGGNTNAIIQVGTEPLRTYAKRHLVPFGEYLPYKEFFDTVLPDLGSLSQLSGGLIPGSDTGDLEYYGIKIGGLVCYDSIFPELARTTAEDGNEILFLVTNDSWYEDSAAVYQHLGQAVFRAVENGRYIARAANSGVSAMISDKGEVISSIPPLVPGTITEKAEIITRNTLYTLIGEAFMYSSFIFILLYPLLSLIRPKKDKEEADREKEKENV